MDHDYIEQFDLVDRYLMGKLPTEESEQFEEHFIDCSQCTTQLNITRNFLQDLRRTTAEQAAQSSRHEKKERFWSLPKPIFQNPLAWVAGGILLASLGVILFLWTETSHLRREVNEAKNVNAQWEQRLHEEQQAAVQKLQETESTMNQRIQDLEGKLQSERTTASSESNLWVASIVDLPIFALSATRSNGQSVNEITLSRSPQNFALSIGLEGEVKYKDFYIKIIGENNKLILQRNGFKPNSFQALTVELNSRSFQSGNYSLIVEGLTLKGDSRPIGNYPLRINKKS